MNDKLFSLDYDFLPDEIEALSFPNGDYGFDARLKKKVFNSRLRQLQIELVKLHRWIQKNDQRIVMVFEGRDAAGKGGTIKRFMQNLNPRRARVVALSKPTETESGQWYFQRYVTHMPTEGEMVFFDRSWYNRSGVERVMGFCSEDDVQVFFDEVPVFEGMIVRDGIYFFKFWLTVSRAEQLKRFYQRKNSILKSWKLSPMDYKAVGKWDDYSRALKDQIERTSTPVAPWTIIDSNDQRRARLAAIQHVLLSIDYDDRDGDNIGAPEAGVIIDEEEYLKSL